MRYFGYEVKLTSTTVAVKRNWTTIESHTFGMFKVRTKPAEKWDENKFIHYDVIKPSRELQSYNRALDAVIGTLFACELLK